MNIERSIPAPAMSVLATVKPATMADLLICLETAPGLNAKRRRDLKSAVRRICDLVRREPEHFPADVIALRGALRNVAAAQSGLSAKTIANIKANVLAALRLQRPQSREGTGRTPLTPAWQDIADRLSEVRLKRGLSRFVHFCASRGIAPEAVSDSAVDAFSSYLRTETFVKKPNDLLRRTTRLWNEAVYRVEGWPDRRLSVPSFRAPRRTLPLSDLPQSFQGDVAAHSRWLRGDDLFTAHPPPRVCRPATINLRRKHIEGAASALIESGVVPESLKTLADLVTPEAVKALLQKYLARSNNQPTQYHRALVTTMIHIARHWVRAKSDNIEALKDLKRRLGSDRTGLTEKNRQTLRQFDDPSNQALLLLLPDRLVREAARRPSNDARAAVVCQVALAIEILLMAPMRMGNLIRLRVDQHVARYGEIIHLVLPGSETKNGEETVYPLSDSSAALFDLYLRRYRPRLCDEGCPWLFPTTGGTPKAQATLSQQIVETIRKRTGLTLTPHQFRHLAAKLLLDQQPGNYEGTRQLLTHRSLKSTTSFYTELQTPNAARQYDAMLQERRRELAQAAPMPARGSRRRR